MPRVDHHPEVCQFCGNTHTELVNLVMDGRVYVACPDCELNFQCPNCGYFLGRNRDYMLESSFTTGYGACEHCNPDEECEECGMRVAEGTLDSIWLNNGEEKRVCVSCLPSISEHVNGYSYKPEPIFHGDYDMEDEVHLGLELEFYAPDQGQEHQLFLRDLLKHRMSFFRMFYAKSKEHLSLNENQRFYFKWDGSLRNGEFGVEMVTHPHTLYEHKAHIAPFIADVLKEHCFVDSTCGIHVHIDKARMTYLDRAKMHTFLLCNQADVCSLVGRHNEDYAPFRRRGGSVTLKQQLQGHEERHTFLNHRPKNTAEMRIFSSSVEPETVLAYLEFAHALLFFSKKHVLRECTDNASWSRFVAFVKERPQYSELLQLLQEKGLDGVGTCQLAYIPWYSKFVAQITGNNYGHEYSCPACDDTGCPACADYDFGEEPEF